MNKPTVPLPTDEAGHTPHCGSEMFLHFSFQSSQRTELTRHARPARGECGETGETARHIQLSRKHTEYAPLIISLDAGALGLGLGLAKPKG